MLRRLGRLGDAPRGQDLCRRTRGGPRIRLGSSDGAGRGRFGHARQRPCFLPQKEVAHDRQGQDTQTPLMGRPTRRGGPLRPAPAPGAELGPEGRRRCQESRGANRRSGRSRQRRPSTRRAAGELFDLDIKLIDAQAALDAVAGPARPDQARVAGRAARGTDREEFSRDPDVRPLIEQIKETKETLEKAKAQARQPSDPAVVAAKRQAKKLQDQWAALWKQKHDEIARRLGAEDQGPEALAEKAKRARGDARPAQEEAGQAGGDDQVSLDKPRQHLPRGHHQEPSSDMLRPRQDAKAQAGQGRRQGRQAQGSPEPRGHRADREGAEGAEGEARQGPGPGGRRGPQVAGAVAGRDPADAQEGGDDGGGPAAGDGEDAERAARVAQARRGGREADARGRRTAPARTCRRRWNAP